MSGELITVAIVVSPLEIDHKPAKAWIAMDAPDGGYLMRQIRGPGTGREFTQSTGLFEMYARLGVYLVVVTEVTIAELADLVERLDDLDDDQLVAFAGENAVMPPE